MGYQKCVQGNIDLAGKLFDNMQAHFDAVILAQSCQSTTHQEGSPRTDLPPDNRPDETKTDE